MLSRRQLLSRTLQGSTLLALSPVVPQFLINTAQAADPGKDHILVVVEMTGGNDGLNMVIPYEDDLYYKARPTLGIKKAEVVRLNDEVGLHPAMRSLEKLRGGNLAAILGVGYPNPDRSHFESMDKWQSGDPRGRTQSGWLGRGLGNLEAAREGGVPAMHIGSSRLPLAMQGASGGAVSVNDRQPFRIEFGGGTEERTKARAQLIEDMAQPSAAPGDELLDFVARRQVQTLTAADRLKEVVASFRGNNQNLRFDNQGRIIFNTLSGKLQLVAELIRRGFGTRVFYVSIDGFDTHSNQAQPHKDLLGQVADGIVNLFDTLKASGNDSRVRVLTFSEFGRRVQENASKGTDHGAGSCLFVAGPGIGADVIGAHPSLKDLDSGDLKHHTDFRRVYATLLDHWLGIDSQAVLAGKFDHLPALTGVKASKG